MPSFYGPKDAAISIAGITYYGQSWTVTRRAGEIEVTNYESPANPDGSTSEEFIGGYAGATLQVDGVNDPTLTQPIMGASATFVATTGAGHTISGSLINVQAEYRGGTKDRPAGFSFQGRITGALTIT